jgi:hypothetical protein
MGDARRRSGRGGDSPAKPLESERTRAQGPMRPGGVVNLRPGPGGTPQSAQCRPCTNANRRVTNPPQVDNLPHRAAEPQPNRAGYSGLPGAGSSRAQASSARRAAPRGHPQSAAGCQPAPHKTVAARGDCGRRSSGRGGRCTRSSTGTCGRQGHDLRKHFRIIRSHLTHVFSVR